MKNMLGKAPFWAIVVFAAALAGCKGIKDTPEDINVSPRSQESYDPVYKELENDPAGSKQQQ